MTKAVIGCSDGHEVLALLWTFRHSVCHLRSKGHEQEAKLLRITDFVPTCIALQALVLGSFVFTNILVFSRMSCIFCVKDILYFLYAIFKVHKDASAFGFGTVWNACIPKRL